jgi:hypothetical protein
MVPEHDHAAPYRVTMRQEVSASEYIDLTNFVLDLWANKW